MPTYTIRHRRDTTANWLAANPILLDGELGYERTDDGRLLCKMGDGVQGADGSVTGTHWADLPYCSGPAGPSPEFEWSGTSLRFRNADGTWGEWTNLQGARGLRGLQGAPGPTGESVPATRSSLGGVMIGPGLQVTAEGCISIQPDGVTVTVDEDGLLTALGGNLLLNSEEWLTESGTWTAQWDGWHEITVWHGGGGSFWDSNNNNGGCGRAYAPMTYLRYYHAGDNVPFVIGAGGKAGVIYSEGITTFGDLPTEADRSKARINWIRVGANQLGSGLAIVDGVGVGGGYNDGGGNMFPSTFYGAAGGLEYSSSKGLQMQDGFQGAVRIRSCNPAKAAGPLPAPALLSARRMAPHAAAAPATVNLYDPETGQGWVWREEDAEAKLAEGLITEEAWLEICAARAAEERAAWLVDPETEAERFEMLRRARDAKLAEHDVQVVQLQRQARAGADVADDLAAWDAYAVALCDLPAQEGAPWDGGGALTPWPEEPAVTKVQEA